MSVPQYSAGQWTAVVRPGFVALVGPQAGADVARALWDAAPQGVLAVLDVLARDGLAALPPFAVASVDGTRVHVAVRGDVDVEVTTTDGSVQTLRAGAVRTWSEQVLEDVGVLVGRADGAADGPVLPLVEGVAPAGTVRVEIAEVVAPVAAIEPVAALVAEPVAPAAGRPDAQAAAEPVASAAAEPDAPAAAEPVAPAVDEPVRAGHETPDALTKAAGGRSAASTAAAPEPVPASEVAEPEVTAPELAQPDDSAPAVAASEDVPAEQVAEEAPAPEPARPEPARAEERPTGRRATGADRFATLPPVEPEPQAEVADVVEEPVASSDPTRWSVATSAEPQDLRPAAVEPGRYDVVAAAESFLEQHSRGPGLVDLPSTRTTSTAAAVPDLSPASADDHDGLTILSSDLAAIRDQLPSWAADEVPGPFAVPDAAQPARLVLSTGLVVTLDRAVLLGRAPQVARVTNRELPRLVTVPSPQQDISRTHAEVRVEGDHVLVTDLDSTNGVHVARPGEGARRLHPGEPSVVAADEVVDLGDGVTFTVERGS